MVEYIHKHKNQVEAITKLTESVPQDARIMPDGRIMILGQTGFWITEDFSSFVWKDIALDTSISYYNNKLFSHLSEDLTTANVRARYTYNGDTFLIEGEIYSNKLGSDPFSTHMRGSVTFGNYMTGTISLGKRAWLAPLPRLVDLSNNGIDLTFSEGDWAVGAGVEEHPVKFGESSYVILAGGASKSAISRVGFPSNNGIIRQVVAHGNHQGKMTYDSKTNRIWVVEKLGSAEVVLIYSEDEGQTWSDNIPIQFTEVTHPTPETLIALPDSTLVLATGTAYYRIEPTTGDITHTGTLSATVSQLYVATRELADSRILILTGGNDTNVFIFGSVNPITEAESFETVYMATDTPLSFLRPPDTAKFTIDDGTAEGQQITLEVDWPLETTPDFDMRVPGVYVMNGYPKELPKGITNPDNIGAEYTITVIPGSCYRTQPICASWPVPAMPDVPRSIPQDPIMLVRWRSDGKGKWSKFREISLGQPGDSQIVKRILGLGRYRTRQYEIIFFGNVPLSLMSVEEEVKLGGPSQ